MWPEIFGVLATTALTVYLGVRLFCPWLSYDIAYIREIFKVLKLVKKKMQKRELVIDTFEETVRKYPKNTFIIFQGSIYSYEFVNQQANRVARVALQLGLKARDVAALMMHNEPAFVWTFLGLQKIGVSVAMMNYHLRLKALAYSITSCSPKILIVGEGEELTSALSEIKSDIGDVSMYVHKPEGPENTFKSFYEMAQNVSPDPVDAKHRESIKLTDTCSFIFTSGTTGLPKPAIVSHRRTVLSIVAFSTLRFSEKDILYETLPLYHSAGLNLGVFAVVENGAVVVLCPKFSVSNFWKDCRKYNVSVIHYIGEMCRYLVNIPEQSDDGEHNIRVAVGNGLRPDIWERFQKRFKIPQIVEFYAATESPFGFFNIFNKVGIVGRTSPLLSRLFKVSFVKYDYRTQEALRDENGRCKPAGPGEVGLAIATIDSLTLFEGYHCRPEDTKKKTMKDVYKKGDLYFNSGDLFYIDHEYFLYFHDRTGDTYRWKGENVSTSEVSNTLSGLEFVHDANVYGVTVPGCEGKAGMAAIHLKDGLTLNTEQLNKVSEQCQSQLPAYARPRFLRVQRQMSLTSTFKQQKVDLMEESFDPHKVKEPLYFYDTKTNNFKPLDEAIFEEITSGKLNI